VILRDGGSSGVDQDHSAEVVLAVTFKLANRLLPNTYFGLCTQLARKLASMLSVDSARKHCVGRVFPRTLRSSGLATPNRP
jgi:hypothetical protein